MGYFVIDYKWWKREPKTDIINNQQQHCINKLLSTRHFSYDTVPEEIRSIPTEEEVEGHWLLLTRKRKIWPEEGLISFEEDVKLILYVIEFHV